MEIWDNGKGLPLQILLLDEPTFIKAFEEYFTGLWHDIPPIRQDKKEIILWLERKIKMLV